MELRSPIIVTLAHVDHGKTTLLDYIRHSTVAAKEHGMITQCISSTCIPKQTIEKMCGTLLEKFKVKAEIPGLLWIDTPGHAAFATMRQRGGSIADIAVLLIDINEGIMPQTEESIEILKAVKTPFVVAINKIDRLQGWKFNDSSFLAGFEKQSDAAKGLLEEKFYAVIEQLRQRGISAERFDRIQDFTKKVAAVPISAKTGEGVPELLAIITGLSRFIKHRLVTTKHSKGVVLEVNEVTGLGTTIDTIIYDGSVKKGDYLVIEGGKITKIKALLMPNPLKDMRYEKKFVSLDECRAASGVKISAPGLDDVVAGSDIRTAKTEQDAEKFLQDLKKEHPTEIVSEGDGLILKADMIGSLEALVNIFKNYPIKHAAIGSVNKENVIEADANKNPVLKAVVSFNADVREDAANVAKERNIKIFRSDVIYHLIEEYEKWRKAEEEKTLKAEIEGVTRPGKIRLLPGCVFRASNPAIVGCEVLSGTIRPGYTLFAEKRGKVGEIKQVQNQGKDVDTAKTADKVAISIMGPVVGRQIKEGDTLYTDISGDDYKKLKKFERLLTKSEIDCMEEIAAIKKKQDAAWGMF